MFWQSLKYIDAEYIAAGIDAVPEFWNIPMRKRDGGCGAGELGDYTVPDTMWGLPIRGICQIHDFDYKVGETDEDKKVADRRLRNNLIRWAKYKTAKWARWLLKLRFIRSKTYYVFVDNFGGPAFWKGKNPEV